MLDSARFSCRSQLLGPSILILNVRHFNILVFLSISTPIGSSFIVNRLHMYSIFPMTPFHLHTLTLGRQLSALTVSGHAKISNLQYLTLLSMSRTSSVCRSDFSLNRDSRCTKISVRGSLSFYQYLKLRLSAGHALA